MPGLGLLLLRAALGVTAIAQGAAIFIEQFERSFRTSFAGIAVIGGGVLMLLGFLTPLVGALLLTGGLTAAVFLFGEAVENSSLTAIYEVVLSAAVMLLGPGAFSIDARLFGRREIIIPKN